MKYVIVLVTYYYNMQTYSYYNFIIINTIYSGIKLIKKYMTSTTPNFYTINII